MRTDAAITSRSVRAALVIWNNDQPDRFENKRFLAWRAGEPGRKASNKPVGLYEVHGSNSVLTYGFSPVPATSSDLWVYQCVEQRLFLVDQSASNFDCPVCEQGFLEDIVLRGLEIQQHSSRARNWKLLLQVEL